MLQVRSTVTRTNGAYYLQTISTMLIMLPHFRHKPWPLQRLLLHLYGQQLVSKLHELISIIILLPLHVTFEVSTRCIRFLVK